MVGKTSRSVPSEGWQANRAYVQMLADGRLSARPFRYGDVIEDAVGQYRVLDCLPDGNEWLIQIVFCDEKPKPKHLAKLGNGMWWQASRFNAVRQ